MSDIDAQPTTETPPRDDYTVAELVYWIVGIIMIPLAPILMIWFFTPWSGM